MTTGPTADRYNVHEPRPTADLLDEVLSSLPADVVVAHRDGRRLVASTAGVFVLDPDHETTPFAEQVAIVAQATRELLAHHLSWVPFVDWFVVCPTEEVDVEHDVVPLDLVANTVLEGHAVSERAVARIGELLRDGHLAPDWHDGLPSLTRTPPVG